MYICIKLSAGLLDGNTRWNRGGAQCHRGQCAELDSNTQYNITIWSLSQFPGKNVNNAMIMCMHRNQLILSVQYNEIKEKEDYIKQLLLL